MFFSNFFPNFGHSNDYNSTPMQVVQLPVAAFSRKILLAEYGSIEPIAPTQGDLLYQSLRIDLQRTNLALNENKGTLSAHIHIQLGDELSRQLLRSPLALGRVGVHLYKIHLATMYASISTAQRLGLDVKRAIAEFYDQHGITDDDLGMDTAYRYWHREELKKKRKKVAKLAEQSNAENNHSPLPFARISRARVAEEIIQEFTEKYSAWAARHRKRERKTNRISTKKIETISILTLRHINGLNFREIAQILNSSTQSVEQRNRRGILIIRKQPKLSAIYREILTAKHIECPFFLQ